MQPAEERLHGTVLDHSALLPRLAQVRPRQLLRLLAQVRDGLTEGVAIPCGRNIIYSVVDGKESGVDTRTLAVLYWSAGHF